ncbi:MAG TPA: class I SAM-dependent methyltransferase [Puia sp.]|nr:class I SAM-dependent methyltransferase [Puia sp.]
MTAAADILMHPASFRDPAGFVFLLDGRLYRQVNPCYAGSYDRLMQSGLYDALTRDGLLIPHSEEQALTARYPDAYRILQPRPVDRLSYAAEWSPAQLRDAALLTLRLQSLAMDHGMSLKDAIPNNVQFIDGKPVFLDTLSFGRYDPSEPWIAYRQFCENFLFPLYIHFYARTGTHPFAAAWPEGVPAATAGRLLPWRSRWNAGAWLHVHLQARIGGRQSGGGQHRHNFSAAKLLRLVEHLRTLTERLAMPAAGDSAWSRYYDETVPGEDYIRDKERIFRRFLDRTGSGVALDLGCNDGWFARILAEHGRPVIAVDADWQCVDRLYRKGISAILPLCVDLANPTPACGFRNAERAAFTDRMRSDLVVALALVHHLALGRNIPLPLIADGFQQLTRRHLIVEFVPATDRKAMQLAARKDPALLEGYDSGNFEAAFGRYFRLDERETVAGTERVLYLMTKRQP